MPASSFDPSAGATPLRLVGGQSVTADVHVPVSGTYDVLLGRGAGGGSLSVAIDGAAAGSLSSEAGSGRTAVLQPLTGQPVKLAAGTHRVSITATGAAGDRAHEVHGVVLHPTVTRTELQHPDGSRVTLAYDRPRAKLSWR